VPSSLSTYFPQRLLSQRLLPWGHSSSF
jgi:hypothetical protein